MLCFRKQQMCFTYYWISISTSSGQVQYQFRGTSQSQTRCFLTKQSALAMTKEQLHEGMTKDFGGRLRSHYIERMEHLISCSLKATKTFIYKHFYNRVTLLKTEQSNVQKTSCWTGNNTVWVWYYFDLMLTSTANISCQAVSPFRKKKLLNSVQSALIMYFISQKYVFKKLCLQIQYKLMK